MKQIVADEYLLPDGSVDVIALRDDLFDYFNTLHYMLSETEFDAVAKYALGWIQDHLADGDIFNNSVKAKAHEMSSGDHRNDYYKALILRRDQLLAARDVFREYTSKLRDIFSEDRETVISALNAFNFDHGIYLRAEEYSRAREAALNDYDAMIETELEDLELAIESEEQALNLDSGDQSDLNVDSKSRRSRITTSSRKDRSKRLFHRNI